MASHLLLCEEYNSGEKTVKKLWQGDQVDRWLSEKKP
jgi:hypothetical protein